MLQDLFDFQACKRVDQESIASGIPEIQLMGQAALASLYELRKAGHLKEAGGGQRIFILCGPGNNGGDGYALAFHLLGLDPAYQNNIKIYRSAPAKTETAGFYANQLADLALPILEASQLPLNGYKKGDLLLDALLGIGVKAAPRGEIRDVLDKLLEIRGTERAQRPTLIALDVPTGLREDQDVTFSPPGSDYSPESLPLSDEIHSYGTEKTALRLNPHLAAGARIKMLPMGFHPRALKENSAGPKLLPIHKANLSVFLKPANAHKYTAGHGILLGGSPSMEGAAMISADSFFAAGGGILHCLVPEEASRTFLSAARPETMFLDANSGLPDGKTPGAIALGPGLEAGDRDKLRDKTFEWLQACFQTCLSRKKEAPWLILDAGGLDYIRDPDFPTAFRERTIITPHRGEWAKLGGPPIKGSASLPEILEFNRQNACYAIIKDSTSLLLTPENQMALYAAPLPALAVAGSGDCLTGILLAIFARNNKSHSPLEKIHLALELHQQAAGKMIHPTASSFPNLIRETLKEVEVGPRAGRQI